MTGRECAIVEAYTGYYMCGKHREEFYKYISEIMGRPIYAHGYLEQEQEIKERVRQEFIRLSKEAVWD